MALALCRTCNHFVAWPPACGPCDTVARDVLCGDYLCECGGRLRKRRMRKTPPKAPMRSSVARQIEMFSTSHGR